MTQNNQILIICFLFAPLWCWGQIPELEDNRLSPTMATLGQFGHIPVSHFTGTPDISIPLYETSVDGNKIDIAARYHSAGIRLEQKPGWLGVGWNLAVSGAICRITNGIADEMKIVNSPYGEDNLSYWYSHNRLAASDWSSASFIESYLNDLSVDELFYLSDLDPDEFRFSFMGYTGSLFLDHCGQWRVKSDKYFFVHDVVLGNVPFPAIQYTYTGSHHTQVIKGFSLTDENGVDYRFGYDDNAIEYSIPFYNQNAGSWTSSSWQLTQIRYPSGNTVLFSYERGDLTSQMWPAIRNFDFHYFGDSRSEYLNRYASKDGSLISPVFLTAINTPLGTISFSSSNHDQLRYAYNPLSDGTMPLSTFFYALAGLYSQGYEYGANRERAFTGMKDRNLDSIIVTNSNGRRLRKFIFHYYPQAGNKRQFLHDIELERINGNPHGYIFEYYNKDLLPGYLSGKTDRWGYYNGKVGKVMSDFDQYEDSLQTDPELTKYGVISKITYPTGGYTRFEFEANQCGKILNNNQSSTRIEHRTVGGVRIKRIINSVSGSTNDEEVSREYFYTLNYQTMGANGVSSGILAGLPQFYFSNLYVSSHTNPNDKCRLTILCDGSSLMTGGHNSQGSHIGYSEVAEKYPNGSVKVYRYSNFSAGYYDESAISLFGATQAPYCKFSSRDQMRGLLLSEKDFDANGTLRYARDFEYNTNTSNYVRALGVNIIHQYISDVFVEAGTYKHFLDCPLLLKETHTTYSSNNISNTKTKRYEYNAKKQRSKIIEKSHDADSIETATLYLWESPGFITGDSLLSPVSEISRTIIRSPGTRISLDKLRYQYTRQSARLYTPISKSEIVGSSSMRGKMNFDYNQYGNVIYKDYNGTDPTIFLWGYSQQYPVAVIKNASLAEVCSALGGSIEPGDNPDNYEVIIENLRNLLPKASITCFKFEPMLGLVCKTSPSGIKTFYEYDEMGRLNGIRDDTGNYSEIYKYHYQSPTP